jgi:hypothetical protein
MSGTSKKKPFRIFIDDVKIRHTSHWDEDFMSREELEAAYAAPSGEESFKPGGKPDPNDADKG